METLSADTFEPNYQAHLKHLKLKGLQPKTIDAYARAIRRIGKRFDGHIDSLTEQQLTDYFTELIASHSWSAVKLDLYGLKFYYAHVLHKPWVAPGLIKPPRGQRLPDIVTVAEAQRLFASTRVASYRVLFFTLYSLGLRLGEGLRLQVGDIDAVRWRVHIRDSKGNRDRFVPLPQATHQLLQRFWRMHRNPVLLFPNRHGGAEGAATAGSPLDRGGVQKTLRRVALGCGLKKDHAPQPASQLCHPSHRGRRRSDRSPEVPRPPQHPHHRPLHPPHRPHQAPRHRSHQHPDERLQRSVGERPVIRLASIVQRFESAFVAHYRERLRPEHTRALAAIKLCRAQASPKMHTACSECDHHALVPHSCGHRHCPHCQHHDSQRWLDRQLARQLPAQYFLLTFTLPAEFRPLAWTHQRVVYELLLRCAWETLRTFAQNDRHLHGLPGAIAVLHTNTRELAFHPHVHLVMPAAAINTERKLWCTKGQRKPRAAYLFPHKALAKVFRARMLAGFEAASLRLPEHHPRQWVVDCKCVGSGKPALIYLGRYLYRGVIREKDILAFDHTQVRYRWRNARTGKLEQRTLPGADFLWLIVQHVLPKGFRRARNFGFLHPNCKRLIALLHLVLKLAPRPLAEGLTPRAPILCSCCGAVMLIVRTKIPSLAPMHVTTPIPTGGSR